MGTIKIAIDGPSGAGKSTIARYCARELGFLYIDTGALYRAVGLYIHRHGVDPSDRAAVAALLPKLSVTLAHTEDGQRVYLDGEDVTHEIRKHEISAIASTVSAHPEVRASLLNLQRQLAEENNVVMDGRDIGTVVLPDAQIKIFLTATPEDRARRRYEELLEKGQQAEYEQVLKDLLERDRRDSTRSVAPLRQAEDAIRVDTTGFELSRSSKTILDIIKRRLQECMKR